MRGFTWTRRRVALTAAAALGIVVVACETPAPSAIEVDAQDPAAAEIETELHAEQTGNIIRLRRSEGEGEAAPGEPLIVVDGVIVNGGRLSDVDKLDIERIEVVKGEAAALRYGARGQNGVVQIFTKDHEESEIVLGDEARNLPFGVIEEREVPVGEGAANQVSGSLSKVLHEAKERAGRLRSTSALDGDIERPENPAVRIFGTREKARPGGGN